MCICTHTHTFEDTGSWVIIVFYLLMVVFAVWLTYYQNQMYLYYKKDKSNNKHHTYVNAGCVEKVYVAACWIAFNNYTFLYQGKTMENRFLFQW